MVNSWEYKQLPEVLKNGKDGIKIGPFGSQLKKEFLQTDGEYRVYGQENVYADDFRIGTRYLSAGRFRDLSSCELVPNDIVISTMGTIGKCSIVPDYIVPGIMDSHLVRLRTDSSIDKQYFRYYIQSELVQRQIKDLSVGGIMDGLSTTIIRQLEVAVPPLPEQRAIAAALSDADAYIAALEKLIAKKRAIKQGAMQELLTGKRRLPGFEGKWVEMTIGECAEIVSGGTPSTAVPHYWDGDVLWCTPTDITKTKSKYLSNTERTITVKGLQESAAVLLPVGTILLCSRATIGEMCIAANPISTNQGFKNLVCKDHINNEFLYYLLQTKVSTMLELAIGSTFLEISKKALASIEIQLPNLPEQSAIAEILSDMDAEIAALMAKLNKVRNIKQGMMQELLTGRIRLLEQDVEAVPEAKPEAKIVELPKREPEPAVAQKSGHNQQFDDAVMIAGIVNALYSDKYPLGRKKVQKCLYLLRRHQDESTEAFKKKAAGPYADEVRYKGGEPIARSANYIATTTVKDKGTTFARGKNISQALEYIESWGKQGDIKWVADKLKFKKVDELELLATVDMAICDLEEAGTPVSVAAIKHLIATNAEWKEKLKRQTFSDANIARAIRELQTLLQGGN